MDQENQTRDTLDKNQILFNIKLPVPTLNTVETTASNAETMCPKCDSDGNSVNPLNTNRGTSNKLKDFLLGQLSEKRLNTNLPGTSNRNSNAGFILPQLQFSPQSNAATAPDLLSRNTDKATQESSNRTVGFIIPNLFNNHNDEQINPMMGDSTTSSMKAINNSFYKLTLKNELCNRADIKGGETIDLTTALSLTKLSPDRTTHNKQQSINPNPEQGFHIPFIDCDQPESSYLKAISIVRIPNTNDYCQTDVSNIIYRHSLIQPSAFGRVICLNYNKRSPLRKASLIVVQRFKAKQKIKPFLFDTQSPDDKVLAAMNKYHRQNI